MQQIIKILEEIRNVLTHQGYAGGYFSGPDEGPGVAVAMDTAEDAAEAMLAYERAPFQQDDFGENYLRLYGFLQAVFLQQDALVELNEQFLKSKPDTRKIPGWSAIRALRNRITGHPVKHHGDERIFITRISLNQWFLQYQIWNDESQTPVFDEVNLESLYEAYKKGATSLLQMVLNTISTENNKA
jgi:hypothetical protein